MTNDKNALTTANDLALSTTEADELAEYEATIAGGVQVFYDVGAALFKIRDMRLYRETHETFEAYCRERWEFSRQRAHQLIKAADVHASLSTKVDILPANERQARLVASVPPENRDAVWEAVRETAPTNGDGKLVITTDHVEAVVKQSREDTPVPRPVASADGTASPPQFTAIVGDNGDLMKDASDFYIKDGDLVADVTYGQGVFWSKTDTTRFVFYASDMREPPTDRWPNRFAFMDFFNLDYDDEYFDNVVFDPPYTHDGEGLIYKNRYGNDLTTGTMSHEQIIDLVYAKGMKECVRVLKPGGLLWVKCADEIESSEQKCSLCEIWQLAMKMALVYECRRTLVRPTAIVQQKDQKHAKKNDSFLWIFKKPRPMAKRTQSGSDTSANRNSPK